MVKPATSEEIIMPDQNRDDPRFKVQPTPETGQTDAWTPVSDDKMQPDSSGQHGRPTDDSDPGHSRASPIPFREKGLYPRPEGRGYKPSAPQVPQS
ncbi:hypothetical protein GCM10022631_26230 [Deinococcus rubellus]|uniref:Uncharacterized protein n=1 Tax=Deinococcus rubellus TaxID=1889240 RepID=A0ABY5YF28_9DEIO|nr:hypothetical protein [Deinococcus rubellus]UWX63316.1 hypothetical protein N0D28_11225 [Deinococcus rubellus]